MSQPRLPESSAPRAQGVWIDRGDVSALLRLVERVYENVQLLADEGIVASDPLDLQPGLTILRRLIRDGGR